MPLITESTYKRPGLLFNEHLETIIPGLFRRVNSIHDYVRERIDTPDGDFLDLDWLKNDSKKAVIISHGLEGDSSRPYVRGMAKAFYQQGWDALAWNFRGCSGEMNRQKIFYHSGATYDLETIVAHCINNGYEQLLLVGFSLGGNMTLKYLGETSTKKYDEIIGAVVFSVPLDLAGCSKEIDLPHNILYSKRFLKNLRRKARLKAHLLKDELNIGAVGQVHSIYDFDDQCTAPLHGFRSADHYYSECSSINFVEHIKVPTLVVNALNDPFLSESCYNSEVFKQLDKVTFETPEHGGHVGFSEYNSEKKFWSEKRALEFVDMLQRSE